MKRQHRIVILLLWTTWSAPARADRLKPFPWFNRGDPKIQTEVFLRRVNVAVAGKRIAIYPFELPANTHPEPLPFGPALEQALYQEGTAAAIEYLPEAPWEGLAPSQGMPVTDRERWKAALRDGQLRRADLVIVGRTDSMFRTAGGGLVIKLMVRVIDTHNGHAVWYGRKRADWIRRFPIEDCYLNVAWSLVSDWRGRKD